MRFFHPAAHFQRRDTALCTLFVLFFGALLDVFQQGIDVPVFRVVILDVAGINIAEIGHPVVFFAGRDDDAVAVRVSTIADHLHQFVCRLFRQKCHAGGQLHAGLRAEVNRFRPRLGLGKQGFGFIFKISVLCPGDGVGKGNQGCGAEGEQKFFHGFSLRDLKKG